VSEADWTENDRGRLRRSLIDATPPRPTSSPMHRLGSAVARRDTEALRRISAAPTPLARLRLALARAEAGLAPLADDPGWSATDRRRLLAADVLARPSRVDRRGATPFLFDQAIPIVEARVNGDARGYFIVDTGAPHTALSKRWCAANGVALDGGVVHGVDDDAGNEIAAVTTRLRSIAVGAVAVDVPAIAFDFPAGLDVAGILSPLDVFAGEAVTLDYAVRRLAIGDDAAPPSGVPLFWEGGVPLMPARVGGVDAMMLFDTGAGGEVLCARFAERFRTDHLLAATTRTAAGTVPVRLGLIQPLQIGGAAAIETRFAVKPCVATGSDTALIGCDGMIGGTWMAGRRLTIDADRLTLWFDGA